MKNDFSQFQPAMKTLTNYIISDNPRVLVNPKFVDAMDALQDRQLMAFARLLDANRITVKVDTALAKVDSPGVCKLRRYILPTIERMNELENQRDALLSRLVSVLGAEGVDFVVFKTLNASGWIGVDVDVMIAPSDYKRCIGGLLGHGFYSIDDLSKKYATGFMVKGNSIIVDLHTKLAILGVRYMTAELLLANKQPFIHQSAKGDAIKLYVLNELMDALVRMVHAILKEGSLTVAEVAAVLNGFYTDEESMKSLIEAENFWLSAAIFFSASNYMVHLQESFTPITFREGLTPRLARSLTLTSIYQSLPPYKFHVAICMLAFLDHLKSGNQLAHYVPSLLNSFRFKRNTAYLGHKVFLRN
jgi:hypothetical protein